MITDSYVKMTIFTTLKGMFSAKPILVYMFTITLSVYGSLKKKKEKKKQLVNVSARLSVC